MGTLLETLRSNPKVANVTRGTDIWRYQSPAGEEDEDYASESYVETETQDGEQFYWLLDIRRQPSGWTLCRDISKQYDGGAQSVQQFEDCTFSSFDELANKHAELMNEFIKSADNFDFSLSAPLVT